MTYRVTYSRLKKIRRERGREREREREREKKKVDKNMQCEKLQQKIYTYIPDPGFGPAEK